MELTDIRLIKDLLARHGFHFSKSMGQNFLIAPWVPEQIAEESGVDKTAAVLEVGPGIGCLTAQLARRAARVVSVELDTALAPILDETLADYDNVEIIYGDVLKQNLPQIVAERFGGLRPLLCANLPYNVTSPLLTAFIEARCFESITVMIQREVAHRICAAAGSSDYGAFSVFVQWHCETEILFDVSPDCFLPAPKVTSSVIKLTPRAQPPVQVADEKLFFRLVRASFNQRRKTLLNGLSNGLSDFSKEQLAAAIAACGFDERVRGETLDISSFAALANYLSS